MAVKTRKNITFKEISSDAGKVQYKERPRTEENEIRRSFEIEERAKILAVKLYGIEQFLTLQRDWASHIKWQIWAVLGFQFTFILLVGFNPYHFTDNIIRIPYMFVGVILQNLANIIALGFVVAQFLFPKNNEINHLEKQIRSDT
ncbi:MAG: hypothetical protein AAB553_07520 [Patescibacteria group bacterium]